MKAPTAPSIRRTAPRRRKPCGRFNHPSTRLIISFLFGCEGRIASQGLDLNFYIDQAKTVIDKYRQSPPTDKAAVLDLARWVTIARLVNIARPDAININSGSQQNRLNLALTLKSESNLLFFDEPTNDLDVNTMRALEEAIEGFAGSAVLVSHDRWFLDRLATRILAFDGSGMRVRGPTGRTCWA